MKISLQKRGKTLTLGMVNKKAVETEFSTKIRAIWL